MKRVERQVDAQIAQVFGQALPGQKIINARSQFEGVLKRQGGGSAALLPVVSLLAKAYAQFAESLPDTPGFARLNPSGYAESQGKFTLRVAEAMRPRLKLPCAVDLAEQRDFPEPRERVNTDSVDGKALGWSEAAAWDEMATWYREVVAK
jgi:hypothetical protein